MSSEYIYDYVICGGGTAGCAIASRLKQGRPDLAVAIVERGADEASNPLILNPLAMGQLVEAGLDSLYPTQPQPHLNDRVVQLHGGNVLSGSSAVNAGVWMRGDRKDYAQWAQLAGDERWSYEGLLPYFKRSETHYDTDCDPSQHGYEGPIKTTAGREYPLRKPFLDAFLELGLKQERDLNDGNPLGIGKHVENWSPKRQPSSLAYDLSGVKIISNAFASRILMDTASTKQRAIGVEVKMGTETFHVVAKREVVICCGSYRTPQLLMLSGIGPRDQLSKFGIPVTVESPDVGQNLFDHLACFVPYRLKPEAAAKGLAMGHPDFMAIPRHLEGMAADWSVVDSLPADELQRVLALDSSSGERIEATNALLQRRAHLWFLAAYLPLALGDGYDIGVDGQHISIGGTHFQPTSRGSVALKSANPSDLPLIDPNYNSTNHDRYAMRELVRKVIHLTNTSSLKPFIEEQVPHQGKTSLTISSSNDDIDDIVRQRTQSIHHPAGTCAIGKVLDSQLRVIGVEGLRVCDASVFPVPVSATIQVTVYALAESLADLLLQEA